MPVLLWLLFGFLIAAFCFKTLTKWCKWGSIVKDDGVTGSPVSFSCRIAGRLNVCHKGEVMNKQKNGFLTGSRAPERRLWAQPGICAGLCMGSAVGMGNI